MKRSIDEILTYIAVDKGYLQDNVVKRYIDYLEQGAPRANHINPAIHRERDLSILSVIGAPTATEIMDVLFTLYLNAPTRFFLWDLRKACMSKLSLWAIKALVRAAGELAEGTRHGQKSAFLLSSRLQIGLLRLATMTEEVTRNPVRYRIFRSMDDAIGWLEDTDLATLAEASDSADIGNGRR